MFTDEIIGAALILFLIVVIGIGSIKTKRRWGTNPHDAKYGKSKK